MTSGVDELEAFLAALRLSFLTSSMTTSSPEAIRQSILAFRAALRPDSIVAASSSPTVTQMQKQDDGNHHDFVDAGEPISATSTTWGDDDRIDVVSQLTKQMDLINAEHRQGTDHIRELVRSVEELKMEVRELRSTTVAPKSLASTEDHPPPPIMDAVENCAISTPVYQAQVEPAPSPHAAGGSRSIVSTPCPQPILEVTTSSSIPSPITSARSFIPPKPPSPRVAPKLVSGATPMTSARTPRETEAAELPNLPHMQSGPPSAAPCPVAISTPAHTLNAVPMNSPYCPGPPSSAPVPVNTSPVAPETPKPALSDIKPKDYTRQTVPSRTGKKRAARTVERKICATNDEGEMKAEDARGAKDSIIAESRPKSPVIATAIRFFIARNEGDLKFSDDAKITILDHPTTPVGWLYGETTETRRGIFLARYVRTSKEKLNNDHIFDNSETKPGRKSPVIVTAVERVSLCAAGADELTFSTGDKICVLDSPDIPPGWLYGEITETRRGIFPARYVTLEND